MHSQTFSFHKTTLDIRSDTQVLIENIQRDFSFFQAPVDQADIKIEAFYTSPPYDTLPAMRASYVSPRNVCYYHQGIKYIDYSGKGLVIYNAKNSSCRITSNDPDLLHEICYMCILSLVNEKLERRHLHRVHALGLAIEGQAILILLDTGGGKSTLAINLLALNKDVSLISEDSPLINRQGQILPFPIRIGLHQEDVPPAIPPHQQRIFKRSEFGPKILIDSEYFEDQICQHYCQPHAIIIGRRVLGRQPEIKPSSSHRALKEFIKNSVIGLGLYQGIEYIFQKGPLEIIRKIPTGTSRLINSLKVVGRSRAFDFFLGADKEKNTQILNEFLKNLGSIKENESAPRSQRNQEVASGAHG